MIASVYPQVMYAQDRRRTFLALLRVRLALHEYQSRRRSLPADLQALSRVVGTVDVTDPFTGKPLHHRRRGRTYALYSLGPDKDDDGGRRIGRVEEGVTPDGDIPE